MCDVLKRIHEGKTGSLKGFGEYDYLPCNTRQTSCRGRRHVCKTSSVMPHDIIAHNNSPWNSPFGIISDDANNSNLRLEVILHVYIAYDRLVSMTINFNVLHIKQEKSKFIVELAPCIKGL